MSESTKTRRGSHITFGLFVFVIVAMCVTAVFGTGIYFGAGDVVQTFAPEPASSRLADHLVHLAESASVMLILT